MGMVTVFLIGLAAFALSAVLIRAAIPRLEALGAVDNPIGRSSHSKRTPNTGGSILFTVAIALWLLTGSQPDWPVLVGLILLLCLSLLDDLRGLGVWLRLGAQGLAIAFGLFSLINGGVIATDHAWFLPWLAFLAFGWLWFINAFNFMDGADGLAGVEATTVTLGLVFVSLVGMGTGVILIGAVLGFLVWNWSPAKIFMGDSGSVPLGYLIGYWLVGGIQGEAWAAALILPAYFCWDATLTVFHRWRRGEKLTQGHRRHAYQRAIDRLGSHAKMTSLVLAANITLLALALVSKGNEVLSLFIAVILVFCLVRWLKHGRLSVLRASSPPK